MLPYLQLFVKNENWIKLSFKNAGGVLDDIFDIKEPHALALSQHFS